MKIDVIQDDIHSGTRCNPATCPIALSIRRDYPNLTAHVSGKEILIIGDKLLMSFIQLPDEAMSFVTAFDNEEPVTPITFEVNYESD